MALSLIKKQEPAAFLPEWQKAFLVLVLVALATAVGLAVWTYSRLGRARATVALKEGELKTLDREAAGVAERVKTLKAELTALKALLGQHVLPVRVFDFLEEVTLPQVGWTAFEALFTEPRRLKLRGSARTFSTVAEQIERLRSAPEVERFSLGRIVLESGGTVAFALEIVPKPSLWRQSK